MSETGHLFEDSGVGLGCAVCSLPRNASPHDTPLLTVRVSLPEEADVEEIMITTDEKHCDTCVCGRRAPVQRSRQHSKPAGSVAWWEHEKAWESYGSRYSQSAERLAERGGFSYGELIMFLGHEPQTWSVRGREDR